MEYKNIYNDATTKLQQLIAAYIPSANSAIALSVRNPNNPYSEFVELNRGTPGAIGYTIVERFYSGTIITHSLWSLSADQCYAILKYLNSDDN